MKRSECTLENMKAKGFISCMPGYTKEEQDARLETPLRKVREGAPVRHTYSEEGRIFVDLRVPDGPNGYPGATHREYYTAEYMEIFDANNNIWSPIMIKKNIVKCAKTASQAYCGD